MGFVNVNYTSVINILYYCRFLRLFAKIPRNKCGAQGFTLFEIHVNLTLKRAVVRFAPFVGAPAEQLFKIVVGGDNGVAFSLFTDESLSHDPVQVLSLGNIEEPFAVWRICYERAGTVGALIIF